MSITAQPTRRRWTQYLTTVLGVTFVMLAAFAALIGLAMLTPEAWLRAAEWVAWAKPFLVLAHFGLIALLWWRWSQLVDWLHRRGRITAQTVKPCLAMRTRVAVWLVLIEVFTVIRPWEWLIHH